MDNFQWLIRMSRWVRHPPSWKTVFLVFAIVAFGLALAGLEWLDVWPEWATMERQRGIRLR